MSNTDIEARRGVRMLEKKSIPLRKTADEQPLLADKNPTLLSHGENGLKTDFVVSQQMLSHRS